MQSNEISHLSIRLTDVEGNDFPLKDGLPTLAQLEISTAMLDREFTLTCMSKPTSTGEGASLFPDNDFSSFSTQLPRQLNLQGWEVSLSGLSLPSHVSGKAHLVTILSYKKSDLQSKDKGFRFAKPLSDFENLNQLMEVLKVEIEADKDNLGNKVKLKDLRPSTELKEAWMALYKEESDPEKKAQLKHKIENPGGFYLENRDPDHILYFKLNKAMAGVMGYPSIGNKSKEIPSAGKVEVTTGEGGEEIVPTSGAFTGKYFQHSKSASPLKVPEIAMLYCDATEAAPTGDTMTNLLNLVPTLPFGSETHSGLSHSLYEPQHLMYVNVKSASFNQISFQLRRLDGEIFPIFPLTPEGSKGGTIIVLRFRPRGDVPSRVLLQNAAPVVRFIPGQSRVSDEFPHGPGGFY